MTPTYDAKSPKQAIDIKVKYVVFHIFPRLLGGREHKRAAHLMPSLWVSSSSSSGSYSSSNFNNTIPLSATLCIEAVSVRNVERSEL